jgi:hypothetical protein
MGIKWEGLLWGAVLLSFILNVVFNRMSKKYYKQMGEDIRKGLVRKVVLIEGRCKSCGERIPDEDLEKIDKSSLSSGGIIQ